MVSLQQMSSVGGWVSGWVSEAFSTGARILPVVTLWVSPDTFLCA